MRINKFIALASGLSRRAADVAIDSGRVLVNDVPASTGQEIQADDKVRLDGKILNLPPVEITIMLNKPVGYVCSRAGQGSRTVYDLLSPEFHSLKPVGRLDKDSSGLLLLTNDGQLAQELTHPKYQKQKVYEIELDKSLRAHDKIAIEQGIQLEDGVSHLFITYSDQRKALRQDAERQVLNATRLVVRMQEGRNRQIRRTFAALGYRVIKLHRTELGPYVLGQLQAGDYLTVRPQRGHDAKMGRHIAS